MKNGEMKILVNGINHWVKIAGAKKNTTPIIVLHGGPGGNNYVFEKTVGKEIENVATVIYYEQRGCGRSDKPSRVDDYSIELLTSDLLELINQLGLKKVSLLGYSFGGQLAMEFALRYPQLIERLILQNPAVDSERITYTQIQGFKQVAMGEIKEGINNIINESISLEEKLNQIWGIVDTSTVDQFLFYDPINAKAMRRMWNEFPHKNTGDMARALFSQKREIELLEDIKRINVPTLLLVGLFDRNIGVDLLRDVHLNIKSSNLVIFEKSAHFPDLEEPKKYVDSIKRFIK